VDVTASGPVEKLRVIDLFCGAGGFALGFHGVAGYGVSLAVDTDRDALATFALNFPTAEVCRSDVRETSFADRAADVVVAGPPCQGFSTLNRGRAGDARNRLLFEIVRCAEEVGARAVVVENVPPMLDAPEGRQLVATLRQRGYHVRAGVLNAANFGVPQTRLRALVIGIRDTAPPWPEQSNDGDPASWLPAPRTVADAFALLPREPNGLNWHRPYERLSALSRARYRSVPEGGSRRDIPRDLQFACWRDARGHGDVLGRLHWRQPASTLRTQFFRPEKGRFLHPSEDRPITVREAARLQSFPDSFRLPDEQTLTSVARQIGNAMPPRLAAAIARALLKALVDRPWRQTTADVVG
jgi:DNA (cytosine-5)-methyltransferase 1